MKDLLPALFLVICGLCGLSLVFKKDNGTDFDLHNGASESASIHISAEGNNNTYAVSKIHVLDKEDINISADSLSRSRF